MENFDRQYRVLIGKNGSSGKEFGAPVNGRTLRCQFSGEMGDSTSANTGKIILWNLAPDSLQLLKQEDCAIELRAGYQNDIPVIMGGTLTMCKTTQNGADSQTEIEFADGFKTLRDTSVSLSYEGSVSGKTVLEDAAEKMGCEIRYSDGAEFSSIENFAFVGKARTLVEQICSRNGLRWSIQNGVIQVCAVGRPITTVAYRLAADTGLIGSPAPVFKSASSADATGSNETRRQAQSGVEVKCLLNGHIQIDDYVKLDSKNFSGNYRVSKIKYSGDTEGTDWFCTATLVEVE